MGCFSSKKRSNEHSKKPYTQKSNNKEPANKAPNVPGRPSETSEDCVSPPVFFPNVQSPVSSPSPESKPETRTLPCGPRPLPDLLFYDFDSEHKSGEFERSHLRDWQTILKQHCNFSFADLYAAVASGNCKNEAINTSWDRSMLVDLAGKLLALPPRDWTKEQFYLINKIRKPGSDRASISMTRQLMKIQEHLKWFTWALGAYLYVSMGGNSKHLGSEFFKLYSPGESFGIPKRIKHWFNGFRYKNVRFKLVYSSSEQGKVLKSEAKAIKLFALSYEQISSKVNSIVNTPLFVFQEIGPLLLYAVPLYSPEFFAPCKGIEMSLFGVKSFEVPSENIFQLKLDSELDKEKPCYLVYNLQSFVPFENHKGYICLFSCAGPEIHIYDSTFESEVPSSVILKTIYPDKTNVPEKRIQSEEIHRFGWDFYIYSDENPRIERRNPIASLLQEEVYGEAVVSLHLNKKLYRRFPLVEVKKKEFLEYKRRSLRECQGALELNENISNHNAFKGLMQRKGLNASDSWVLCAKCRSEKARVLVETDLLARAVKNLVFSWMEEGTIWSLKEFKEVLLETVRPLLHPPSHKTPNNLYLYLQLFLSRLKALETASLIRRSAEESASRIIEPLRNKTRTYDYFLSDEILKRVMGSAARAPALFLQALELHLKVSIGEEALAKARADAYFFVNKELPLVHQDIEAFTMKIRTPISLKEDCHITFLKFFEASGRNSLDMMNESFADWVSEASVDLINKDEEHNSLELLIPPDLYSLSSNSLFFEKYEIPTLHLIEEWANIVETLLKDMITVDGEETVIIEVLLYIITNKYFLEMDSARCSECISRIGSQINKSIYVPCELVVAYYMWSAILTEETNLAEAEQNYITSLMLMTKLLGDPRGRGNLGVPWQMLAAWKISMIAREEKRLFDAQAADEHFDAVFMNTKQFQQRIGRLVKARYTSSRQEQVLPKHPFRHWSKPKLERDSLQPDENFYVWMLSNSLFAYGSGKAWNSLYIKVLVKNTLVKQLSTHQSIGFTSGTSTPASNKETRRALKQSSLTQVLVPENGALNLAQLRGVVNIWGSDTAGQLGIALGDDDEKLGRLMLPYPRMMTSLKDFVIKEIALGAEHCIAITIEGKCFAWGNNDSAQLGLGPDMPQVVGYPMLIRTVNNMTKAACGYQHSLLLSSEGTVFSMGIGEGGVLGHGNTHLIMYPKMIQALKSTKVQGLYSGAFHSVALSSKGQVYVWGRGEGGQLGLEQSQLVEVMQSLGIESFEPFVHTPQLVKIGNKKTTQIACGEAHTLALNQEGAVYAWGWGSNGQLGNGIKHDDFEDVGNLSSIQFLPKKIKPLKPYRIKHIAAGGLFSMFVTSENEVLGCGLNDFSQVGIVNPKKNHTDIAVPTQLECFSGYPIQYISCGENFALGVSGEKERMTWAWGRCSEGQLGLGECSHSHEPRPIQSLNNAPVYKVSTGRMHSAVVVGNPGITKSKHEDIEIEIYWWIVYCKDIKET